MRMKWIIPIMMIVAIAAIACSVEPTTPGLKEQRASQEQAQVANQNRAISDVPIPVPSNFQTRQQVARWMSAMDEPQVWYIYVYPDGVSSPIGFFVADAPSTPYCAFLTPPEQILKFDGGTDGATNPMSVAAPGLDGVFYGSGNCYDFQYFWDEASGAMVQVKGFNMIMLTSPLDLDVPALNINVTGFVPAVTEEDNGEN